MFKLEQLAIKFGAQFHISFNNLAQRVTKNKYSSCTVDLKVEVFTEQLSVLLARLVLNFGTICKKKNEL